MQRASSDPKKVLVRRSIHTKRWHRHYHAIPGLVRLLILAGACVFVFSKLSTRFQDRRDYDLKTRSTNFTSLAQPRLEALWHPQRPVRRRNGTHIDERYVFMRELGKGMEGSAALYVDVITGEVVVVKTYTGPMRNKIPMHLDRDSLEFSSKWPVEIEAGLLIGSCMNWNKTSFVPVRDYFIMQSESSRWHWAMVTPFMEAGTLSNLAEATRIHERTPQKLDKIFRPVFNDMLQSLEPLHTAGYCHNDIKPDNILVANTTHWLLGDLGNVRHFEHPWHRTRRFKRKNQWADCALNDVRRTLNSYMTFLRNACEDPGDFDLSFAAKNHAWSMLYWMFMRDPLSNAATLEHSELFDSSKEPEWKAPQADRRAKGACLRRKIDLELTCTTLHMRVRDYWPFRRC